MKEVFEYIYNGVINIVNVLGELVVEATYLFAFILIFITVPIWILPYHFWKKSKKEGDNDG